MTRLLIQGGRVIDPSQGVDRVTNVLIESGRVAGFDAEPDGACEVLDAGGMIVAPGLIDLHVHLREPGREEDETIATGTAAALAGGFTTIACLPDTEPAIDTQASVEFVQHQAARAGHCNVAVVACVSKNREGRELAELGQLVRAGAVAFSDNDAPLHDAELMRRAFEYCLMFDKPLFSHPEVRELARGGVMHEGRVSMVLGLAGIPAAAEQVMVGRDIVLAEATGGRLHVCTISTAGGLEIIRRAKRRDVRVTTEVCPHHFALTDDHLRTFDSNFKVNPPLRSREDVMAVIAALVDGTIDAICSDHSPHASEKKMQELDTAPFGMVGLETTVGLVATCLVEPGHLTWPQAIEKLSTNPARILGSDRGTLAPGAEADVVVIDPTARWTVDPSRFRSKSRNTPFAGWELSAAPHATLVSGEIRYLASRAR